MKGHVNGDLIADFARDLEDEIIPGTAGGDNPWGNDDLMDINADEDDWSMPALLSPSKNNNQWHTQVHLKWHRHQARHLHRDQ